MSWATFIFQFFAHDGHHQHGIYRTSLPSGFPGSDKSTEGMSDSWSCFVLVGGVRDASQLEAKFPGLESFLRQSWGLPVVFKWPGAWGSGASPGNWTDTQELNRESEFRLFFQLIIQLGYMILPFLSTPCDKRYVGKSQFSKLPGCPKLQQT